MRLFLNFLAVLAISSAIDFPDIPDIPVDIPDIPVDIPDIPVDIPDIPLPDIDDLLNQTRIDETFEKFVGAFEKKYASPAEQSKALAAFGDNLKIINQLIEGSKGQSVQFGINQFSDLTSEEFAERYALSSPHVDEQPPSQTVLRSRRSADLPKLPVSYDWRHVPNVLGRVGNQGICGCCFAFAATAGAQAAYGIKHKKLVQPSEQQMCDCGYGGPKPGCSGGNPRVALKYVKDHGVSLETAYPPYSSNRATVNTSCEDTHKPNTIHVSDVQRIDNSTATKMLPELVAHGPLVAMIRLGKSIQYYKSGVYNKNDCDNDKTLLGWHAVLVIGYGEEKGTPYWIVRNSWGPTWAENGHFRFIRGTGVCGLETIDVGYAIG